MNNPVLVNAEEMALNHPESFDVPSSRGTLKVGDHANVCANGERFWVEITQAKNGLYVGLVANGLVCPGNENLERISFAACNVYTAARNGHALE